MNFQSGADIIEENSIKKVYPELKSIWITPEDKAFLDSQKLHRKEPYYEVFARLVRTIKAKHFIKKK